MKLIVVIFLLTIVQVNAESYAQSITLSRKNVSIENIFKEIKKQTHYRLICNTSIIKGTPNMDVDVEDLSLHEFLDQLAKAHNLSYVIENKTIVVKKRPVKGITLTPPVQQREITGKVTDKQGAPLQGVTVTLKNTQTVTTTNADGQYSISVPQENSILVYTIVGFSPIERVVSSNEPINVTLEELISDLEEVVVVGYGTQKKINLTGAVSTLNFDETMENRPITNASQALGGTVSGLWVSQNTGRPGSDGAQIRVRGWGTLNNSDPMVLIDGVEGSMGQVNPNDIESITVLKDAASSAIYGSRAANGVVLITLKSGKFVEDVHVNLSSYFGVQSLGRRYDIIDNSAEYMRIWNQALINQEGSALFPDEVINDFENGNDPYKYPNTNFFDYIFKNSTINEHNLSVAGGSEKGRYYISFNYLNQDGIIQQTSSQRYGLTANIESKIKDWLTVGGRLNGIKKAAEEPYDFDRILYIFANGGYPFTAPYTADGRFGAVQALDNSGNILVDQRNPLIEAANGSSQLENSFLKMNAFVNVELNENFALNTNFTSQYTNNLTDKYNQHLFGYTDTDRETTNLNYPVILEANRNTSHLNYQTLFSTLNFNKEFGIHSLSAVAGIQIENTEVKTLYGRRTDPPLEGLTQVDAGTSGIIANGNMNALRMLSYFGRINSVLFDKYLFEINLRADASSRFKQENRWGVFPAFSAGWRLNEESFIKDLNIFSNLKLRASWGQLGNQNVGSYWPYVTVINQNNELSHNFDGALIPGAAVTALVDETVSWETSTTLDIGLDVELLNSKLMIEADYFNKITSDIIVQLPIPLVLGGLDASFENVGKMSNKGYDLNMTYTMGYTDRDKFGYKVGANFTYVNNEVTDFGIGRSPDQLYLIREGYSYKSLYGFKAIGVYQSEAEGNEHMHANGYIPQAGELKYEDVNGDGRLDFQDKVSLGSTIPKLTFGLTGSFSYQGFDLNILLQGITGVNAYTNNAWTKPFGISGGTVTKRWKDAWTPENTNTDIPALRIDNAWDNQPSSFWVDDISYIKVKNIQLGYAFPSDIANSLGLQKLYAYANGQNLFSLTSKSYEGFDPERNTFDSGSNFYPIPMILSFGINVSL